MIWQPNMDGKTFGKGSKRMRRKSKLTKKKQMSKRKEKEVNINLDERDCPYDHQDCVNSHTDEEINWKCWDVATAFLNFLCAIFALPVSGGFFGLNVAYTGFELYNETKSGREDLIMKLCSVLGLFLALRMP